jgi:hypothetical protein
MVKRQLTFRAQINSFYGQTQFQYRFGSYDAVTDKNVIPAEWQSGLSNSAVVGQLFGCWLMHTAKIDSVIDTL